MRIEELDDSTESIVDSKCSDDTHGDRERGLVAVRVDAKRVLVGAGARILFYPTLLYNVLRNKIQAEFRWWDQIDQFLLLGAVPFPKDVPRLKQLGVGGVITLNEPYETLVPASLYHAHEIDHLVIPTRDYLFAPSFVDINRAVDFIHRNACNGQTTYVHCKAGRGRSTTIVLCYLVEYKHLSPMAAFEYVRSRRPRIQLALAQWKAVQEYKQQRMSSRITCSSGDAVLITKADLEGYDSPFGDDSIKEGTIPSTMCNFLYLFRLALSGNRFSDEIPSCVRNLTSLRILQLDNNKWNSTIPSSLWHLQHLLTLDLSSNFFVGSLPPEIGNLKSATEINLSMNQLSGNIPRAIEDLKNLETFSLARNGFQGSIPESIGQMVSLESLDLSQNNLSGPIPFSLENLTYLFYFNVSFNDLSGEIPSDGPFKNFTSQSFLSNKRLCGDLKYNVAPCNVITKRSKGKRKLLVVLISLGISGLVFALILSYLFAKYKRKEGVLVGTFDWSGPTPVRFSYYELMKATNGYDESNLLGRGSFGSVYRGNLRNGKDVAVKVFNLQSERASNSFEIECEILRKLRHKNLCKVISSCCSQDFRALVLEYASNGSLEKWLYSHNYFLDIVQRISIMIDIASAMEYLHYGYSTPIIHCDLKPSNILLDEHMSARLCDFGIAKLMNDGESVVRTITLASMGYIAPEFGLDGLVSKRCDVYSYGIVLMEVFTRMRPDDEAFGGDLSLRSWVKERMPDGIIHITDSNLLKLDEEFHKEKLSCLASIFELALCCCMESPSERINIKDVLVALEKIKHQLQAYYNPEIKK